MTQLTWYHDVVVPHFTPHVLFVIRYVLHLVALILYATHWILIARGLYFAYDLASVIVQHV